MRTGLKSEGLLPSQRMSYLLEPPKKELAAETTVAARRSLAAGSVRSSASCGQARLPTTRIAAGAATASSSGLGRAVRPRSGTEAAAAEKAARRASAHRRES